MPISLIVLILLVSVQVCIPRLDDFSLFSLLFHIVFHHDGPFDACAPSRNKHRTKAPMYAWTSINAEDEAVPARYRDKEDGVPALAYDPSYSSDVSRSPPATAQYSSYYSEPPKKKVDAIAEAWGIHEPEPYEEFSAGGGPDVPVTNSSSMREPRSYGRRAREDLASRPRSSNRIPPPQPFSSATAVGQSLRPTLPSSHPVLAGPTSAAISLSYSAFVKCVILPMYLSALMRRWMLLLMVGPPNSTKCGGAQLMTMMIFRISPKSETIHPDRRSARSTGKEGQNSISAAPQPGQAWPANYSKHVAGIVHNSRTRGPAPK